MPKSRTFSVRRPPISARNRFGRLDVAVGDALRVRDLERATPRARAGRPPRRAGAPPRRGRAARRSRGRAARHGATRARDTASTRPTARPRRRCRGPARCPALARERRWRSRPSSRSIRWNVARSAGASDPSSFRHLTATGSSNPRCTAAVDDAEPALADHGVEPVLRRRSSRLPSRRDPKVPASRRESTPGAAAARSSRRDRRRAPRRRLSVGARGGSGRIQSVSPDPLRAPAPRTRPASAPARRTRTAPRAARARPRGLSR